MPRKKLQPSESVPAPRKQLTVAEMQRGIDRLNERIGELKAFDVGSMKTETPPEIAALETSVKRTIERIFGENTTDAQRYSPASDLQWTAGVYYGDYPQFHHYQQGIKEKIDHSVAILEEAIKALQDDIEDSSGHADALRSNTARPTSAITQKRGNRVCICHGRSLTWMELKDFIQHRLELPWDEFNRVSVAGVATTTRLSEMLDESAVAFLIMTGEDERADGIMQARMNVVHEAGLFQGRLGFTKAIVLLEDGCEEFSNIHGLGQLRFPKGNIKASFEEIRRFLEREHLLDDK